MLLTLIVSLHFRYQGHPANIQILPTNFKMMSRISQVLAVTAALTSTALAVPDVTATEIPGCDGYPSGSFLVQLANSGNSSIEGFSDTSNYVLGSNSVAFAYITFPDRNDIAKNPFRCTNDVLQAVIESGVSSLDYEPMQISPYPYDATMGYDFGNESTPVKAFTHSIDGVQQDGTYLGGYENTTTWGVKYEANAGARGQSFFYIRLLGPNSADPQTGAPLQEGEFTSFIKVAS